jgi:hypothetical protein
VKAASPHVPEFSRTLQSLQAAEVDVMVLGDLHLREDSMDAFCEAREQMKVCCEMLPRACCLHRLSCKNLERHLLSHHTCRLIFVAPASFAKCSNVYLLRDVSSAGCCATAVGWNHNSFSAATAQISRTHSHLVYGDDIGVTHGCDSMVTMIC